MERRFACTACGKCCHGLIPLTIDDALAHADKFPLVMSWTPVRQGGRSYKATEKMGITIQLKKKKSAAIRISPMAYIPSAFHCPELTEDGLCGIHEIKPTRCSTMPFSASRDESDQEDLLIPRPGWLCDTSSDAPVVYRDKTIVARSEYEVELDLLRKDASILKPYATWLMQSVPSVAMELQKVAMRPTGGMLIVGFSTLVPRLPKVDIYDVATKQLPIMKSYADRTRGIPNLKEFHKRYTEAATEWQSVVNTAST